MKPVDGFVRDNFSGSVLNTDNGALQAYKYQKKKHKEFESLKEQVAQIDQIKGELLDIKNMLRQIVANLKE